MKYFIFLLFLISIVNFSFAQNIPIPATAQHSGGTYSIYRSSFDNTITINAIRKPLIWVEGFEVSDPVSISQNYNLLNNGTLASQLHAAGYDIVILNFNDATDFIQRNAKVLEQLIQNINGGKPNSEELVVMGYSMGGLVARYALVEMENNNIDHDTRLYISYDSPHKGAHVPVSIQALALTFNSTTWRTLFPEIAVLIDRFNSPAASQMLKYRIASATTSSANLPVSATHTAFMNEINGLNSNGGFPVNCQSVALSLGSWSGIPQRANFDSDGDGALDFQYSGFPAVYINIPQSQNPASVAIWNLNTCQALAGTTLQAFLSTAVATYPYASTRSAYLGLGNNNSATYWYRNTTESQALPLGAWSNIYAYSNEGEPIDFAPGSQTNSYQQVVQTINQAINSTFTTEVQCSMSYYNNSTFVPTVSALAYNTTDLFYKIGDDPNRLSKTPFNDIFATCGENRSHTAGIAASTQVVSWVLNKVNGVATTPCFCGSNATLAGPSEVCNSGSTFTLNDAPGATVSWQATPANLFVVSSGTGTSATLTPANSTSSGNGYITFTISTACSSTRQIQKPLWVNRPYVGVTYNNGYPALFTSYPDLSDLPIPYNSVCNLVQTSVNVTVSGASNGNWQKISANPSNVSWSSSGNNLQFYLYSIGQTVLFRHSVTNSCGTTSNNFYFKSQNCGGGGGGGCNQFSVSPISASTTVNIAVPNIPPPCNSNSFLAMGESSPNEETQNDLTISAISLVDSEGQEKHSQHFLNRNKKVDLDVSNLKKGTYILKITSGQYVETHRIIIK